MRILIAQPGFLGDVVLSTPLIRAVRNCWPRGELAVMVRPAAVPLLDGLPFIDRVFADRPAGGAGLRSTAALIARLRRGCYDLAITPSRSLRVGAQRRAAGLPRPLGLQSPSHL